MLAPSAQATVMVELSIEELTDRAPLIVRADVLRSDTMLERDEHGRFVPHTRTVLEVRESLRGGAALGTTVLVDEIGGTFGEYTQRIVGTPTFTRGEQVIVFLRPVGDTPEGRHRHRTVGMEQGRFEVLRPVPGAEPSVVRDLGSLGIAEWEGGTMRVRDGGGVRVTLAEFRAIVTSIVADLDRRGLDETDVDGDVATGGTVR